MKPLIRGFLSLLSGKVTVVFLSIVITPILVRLLGSSRYGDYSFIMSLYGIVIVVIHAGIDAGLRKYIAEDRSDPNWVSAIFGFYFRIAMGVALIASIFLIVAVQFSLVDIIIEDRFQQYFLILGGMILASQLYSVGRSSLMGLQLEHYSEPVKVIRKFLFGSISILLVYLGYGVAGALTGYVIATSIGALITLSLFHRRVSLSNILTPAPISIRRRTLLSFNILTVLLTFLTVSLYQVDILLLQPISGSTQTGYYRAALVVAEFLWLVPTVTQILFLYSFSNLWSNDNINRINQLSSKVTRYTTLFTILVAIGLFALADPFVPLYFGEEFSAAIGPMLILLPGALCFAVARPIFAIGMAKDQSAVKVLIFATGTAALLNLLLNLLLIPTYGMYGAATATSIGYGSMILFHVITARRIGFDPIADLRPVRIGITTVLSAPLIILSAYMINSDLISLLLVPLLGFIVFALSSVLFGAVDKNELRDLANEFN